MSVGQVATADYLRFSLTYGSAVRVCAPRAVPDGWDGTCPSLEQGGALLHAANTMLASVLIPFTAPLLILLALAVRLAGRDPVLVPRQVPAGGIAAVRFHITGRHAIGRALHRCRLDDLPVLFSILDGTYFFGPRRAFPRLQAGAAEPMRRPEGAPPLPELVSG